jgi:hypothetical protein
MYWELRKCIYLLLQANKCNRVTDLETCCGDSRDKGPRGENFMHTYVITVGYFNKGLLVPVSVNNGGPDLTRCRSSESSN